MRYTYLNPYKSTCSFEDEPNSEIGAGGNAKPSLNSVIQDATVEVAKQTGAQIEEEEKNNPPKPTETKEKPEDKKNEPAKPDDLNENQLAFAKDLYKALSNPDLNIQKQAVKILANAAGLDLKEVETKQEKQEAEETLLDLLKAGLGEYDFLAEKLAAPLEKALNKLVTAQTKETKEALQQIQFEKIKSEANTAIDIAFAQFKNSSEVIAEVKALQDKFPPSKNLSTEEYFTKLIKLAAVEKGLELKKPGDKSVKDQDKVNKNRNDVGMRLSSERGAEVKIGVKTPGKMTLNDAVKDALESLASQK